MSASTTSPQNKMGGEIIRRGRSGRCTKATTESNLSNIQKASRKIARLRSVWALLRLVERSVVRMPERMVKSRRSQSTDFSPKDMKSRDYWKGGWSTSWSGREINSTICRRSRTFMQARSARTRHTRFWQFLALDVRMEDVPGFASNPNRPYNSFCCFRIWYQNQ